STVAAATDLQLNLASTRRRPLSPKRCRRSGESSSSANALASASLSPGGTRSAHSPSGPATSGIAPARLTTSGVPQAMNSTVGSEKPSYSDGTQATSADPMSSASSASV